MGDLLVLLAVAAVVGTAGVAFGIFVLAPRLERHTERSDEEPGAGSD
jgi:hypothetical protein